MRMCLFPRKENGDLTKWRVQIFDNDERACSEINLHIEKESRDLSLEGSRKKQVSMTFSAFHPKGLYEFALAAGLTFIFSYLFNFVWESVHSVWLYGDHDLGADPYVRMICYASAVDAFLVLGIFFFIALAWRDAFWIKRMDSMHALAVLLAGILVSGIVEYRAVYVLKEWSYGPDMPIIFGIGLSPLVQISVTGLLALWLTGRLLYRCGPYSMEGKQEPDC